MTFWCAGDPGQFIYRWDMHDNCSASPLSAEDIDSDGTRDVDSGK